MWEDFLSHVQVVKEGGGPWVRPAPIEIIVQAGRALSANLPFSYTDFARHVGGGTLSRYFLIFTPNEDARWCNLVSFVNENKKALMAELKKRKQPVLEKGFLPFGKTVRGDVFGWNTRQVTSFSPREYPIYLIDSQSKEVPRVAENFPDFINNVCLGTGLKEFIEVKDYEVCKEFAPFPVSAEDAGGEAVAEGAAEMGLSLRFARRVKRLREEAGWSPSQAAKKLGVDLRYYKLIEEGQVTPTVMKLSQLAGLYGMPLHNLFKFEE